LELGRAGSLSLKNYFQDQINGVLARRGEISQSVRRTDSLNAESQAKYYSAWYYAAIHIIISIPEFQTVHAISERLKLPQKIVGAALEFLDSVGLAILQEGKFCIGPKRIHLSPDSDLIIQHHTNWRLQSIYGLERRSGSDIHYSSVYSIAKSDLAKIRGILIRAVEQFEPMIMDSKEEEIICINFDLMTL
ncbi:MAG: DUF4423 domain-containing protein, partial [Proteobacteria bacterium]|nr:DUF4423 domain-containing protein [Pseudomonadota bacterium]